MWCVHCTFLIWAIVENNRMTLMLCFCEENNVWNNSILCNSPDNSTVGCFSNKVKVYLLSINPNIWHRIYFSKPTDLKTQLTCYTLKFKYIGKMSKNSLFFFLGISVHVTYLLNVTSFINKSRSDEWTLARSCLENHSGYQGQQQKIKATYTKVELATCQGPKNCLCFTHLGLVAVVGFQQGL